MNDVVRDQQGVDRCHKVVKTVMPNDPKNPSAGYKPVQAYCSKPMTFSVAEGRKICPDCDKQPPVGWVNPRVTNAAGVSLTKKELEECGMTEDTTMIAKPAKKEKIQRKPREAKKAVEAKVKQVKDAVTVTVTLEQMEQSEDIASVFIRGAIEAMDRLPTPTLAESKRLIKLQERLQSLMAV